jgi:hypothetical protein
MLSEAVPAVPPWCRVTSRLRELADAEMAGRGLHGGRGGPRWQQMSWAGGPPLTRHCSFRHEDLSISLCLTSANAGTKIHPLRRR